MRWVTPLLAYAWLVLATLLGAGVAFLYTSDLWVLGNTTGAATEDSPLRPTPVVAWRPEHEKLVLEAGRGRTLRTAVIRPGIVYGGARGIVGDLLKDAGNALIRVIGDGRNRWACVYHRDLADLYVRVIGDAGASGIYHANDEADERVSDIAEALAQQAKTPADIRNVPLDEARAKLGPYADAGPAAVAVSQALARLVEPFVVVRLYLSGPSSANTILAHDRTDAPRRIGNEQPSA